MSSRDPVASSDTLGGHAHLINAALERKPGSRPTTTSSPWSTEPQRHIEGGDSLEGYQPSFCRPASSQGGSSVTRSRFGAPAEKSRLMALSLDCVAGLPTTSTRIFSISAGARHRRRHDALVGRSFAIAAAGFSRNLADSTVPRPSHTVRDYCG